LRLKLQPSREAEILELSEDIANDDCENGCVSPVRICRQKDIRLVHNYYGEGKFDGMLVFKSGDWIILCNCDNGNTPGSSRERFTIAHELGHYHIPEHRRQLMAGCRSHGSHAGAFDGAESIEELEADTFAANLLMPPTRFAASLRHLKQTPLRSAMLLRNDFDASLESVAIQIMRYDSRVVAIAKWNDDTLAWHRISDPFFRETGFRQFKFRQLSQLQSDCATAEALNDSKSQFNSLIHETVATAAYCFGYVASGGKRDVLLREEAVRNGRFGVVSIFSILNESSLKHF
jgi:hypothetical protein